MQPRLLLCATDAGGVSVLLPVAEALEKSGAVYWFATEARYAERIRTIAGEKTMVVDPSPSVVQAVALLEELAPSAVLCGTTRYKSLDRVLTQQARSRCIRTVGVLDEWSNYRRRFANEGGELVYLPDALAIMDDVARREAVEEGLPENILAITGHPALTKMAGDIRSSSGTYARPPLLDVYPDHLVIAFLSEELRSNFTGAGSMGEPLGFDEEQVLRDIIKEARGLNRSVLVVNKLHPSSDCEETILDAGCNIVVATSKTINLHSLLRHSAMAIGMISVALVEAAMIGIPVASYQPNARMQGLSTAVRLGLAALLCDREALGKWMQAPLSPSAGLPGFVRSDAVQVIVQLALDTARPLTITHI